MLVAQIRMQLHAFDYLSNFFKTPTMSDDELFTAWTVFEKKLNDVGYNDAEQYKILEAFVISYVGHLFAAKRKSGEAYFYHLFRCGMKMLYDQEKLGIQDKDAIIMILLHDVVEEAEDEATILNPYRVIITRNVVILYFGEKVAAMVYWLTKQKWDNEGRINHLERVVRTDMYQVVWGKLTDIRDNFDTLRSMPREKQESKFKEAEQMLEILLDRLEFLIIRGIENGTLKEPGWTLLRTRIERGLRRSIRKQKKRFQKELQYSM
jgi:(p)ppGpp synthase/HD superfamily hydrolase